MRTLKTASSHPFTTLGNLIDRTLLGLFTLAALTLFVMLTYVVAFAAVLYFAFARLMPKRRLTVTLPAATPAALVPPNEIAVVLDDNDVYVTPPAQVEDTYTYEPCLFNVSAYEACELGKPKVRVRKADAANYGTPEQWAPYHVSAPKLIIEAPPKQAKAKVMKSAASVK